MSSGIHHVAARLGHFLSVFAENQALIDEFEERFRRRDVAEIEENLVPEPRVKQVQTACSVPPTYKSTPGVS